MADLEQREENAESTERDMGELIARLSLIRAQVEAEEPRTRFPSKLVGMLIILVLLVLVPVLFSGPCGTAAQAGEKRAELMKRAYDVHYSGGVLYSAVEYGLVAWDVSGAGPPARLGALEIRGSAVSVSVTGTIAWVCAGPSGLYVVDVSNPRSMRLLGRLDTAGSAMDIAFHGKTAFLADGSMGTAILDVGKTGKPVEVGRLDTTDYVRGVAVAGDRLVTAEDRASIGIWQLKQRADGVMFPVASSRVPVPGQAREVVIAGESAWVAGGTGGISLVEMRPGKRPHVAVTLPTADTARGVFVVAGRYLLVAEGAAGIGVLDLELPDRPAEVHRYSLPEANAIRVASDGKRVFAAYDYKGVRTFDLPGRARSGRDNTVSN